MHKISVEKKFYNCLIEYNCGVHNYNKKACSPQFTFYLHLKHIQNSMLLDNLLNVYFMNKNINVVFYTSFITPNDDRYDCHLIRG